MRKKKATRFFSKKERKKVGKLIWQAQLDLHADDYLTTYSETKKQRKIGNDGNFVETARILIKPEYLKAQIEFAPQSRKDFRSDFKAFQRTLYHEVAHMIIDPLYFDGLDELSPTQKEHRNNLREQAVEKVGRIGRWKREIHDELEMLKKKNKRNNQKDD